MKKELSIACAVYDLHYPVVHKPTVAAIFEYLKENPPDIFIFGGDQFNFESISHHTAGKPLYRLRRGYMSDIEGFRKNILEPLEQLLPKHCKKVWIIGNHERFEHDLIERQPELEDLVNHVKLLDLERRGWEIIPLGHSFKLGKLNIVHGEILTGIGNQAGMYPARKALELFAGNVLAGHTHAPQMFTKVSPVQVTNKWQAHIAPIAGAVNPSYLRNRPSAWLNGLVRIEVYDSGQFNLYPIVVVNGKFAFGGKTYGG